MLQLSYLVIKLLDGGILRLILFFKVFVHFEELQILVLDFFDSCVASRNIIHILFLVINSFLPQLLLEGLDGPSGGE